MPQPTEFPAVRPPLTQADLENIDIQLRKCADAGLVDFYVPSVLLGEQFVVGVPQIVHLTAQEALVFLMGITVTCERVVQPLAVRLGMGDAFQGFRGLRDGGS